MPPKRTSQKNAQPESTASLDLKSPVYLVYGDDDLSATRKADAIVDSLCPPADQAFGLETFQAEAGEKKAEPHAAILKNTREALLTPSFLGGNKTVYLRNAPHFNPLTEPGKFEAVKAEVAALTDLLKAGLPDGVHFVVLATEINKTTSFYKTINKIGQVFEFAEPEKEKEAAETLLPRVEESLKELHLKMSPDVLHAFLNRTGYHFRLIRQELDKLAVYLPDERREVSLRDLQLMVAPVREAKFWEYADAFCTGDLAHTLDIMAKMFEQRVSPIPMVVNLQNRLRELMVLRDCMDRGWAKLSGGSWKTLSWNTTADADDILSQMANDPRKLMPPFRAAMLAAQAARFPAARWYKWLNAAIDAQAAMTGGDAIAPEATLELFTARALGTLTTGKPKP